MPQMGFWPFIGRTMVEAAHGVKFPNFPTQRPTQRQAAAEAFCLDRVT
jgi:hypothetical protein